MIRVRMIQASDRDEWLRMRQALWSDDGTHAAEVEAYLHRPRDDEPVFVAERPEGGLCGFLEAGLRPRADGCSTIPVGYVEGWYVDEDRRRSGVGGVLLAAAEHWVRSVGCREMASDCYLDNTVSYRAHIASGYEETARLIHFRKPLDS